MHNAYYPEYDDEMYSPPKRNPTPRRRPSLSGKITSALKKNPKRLFGFALFFGIASVVAVNALVMQTSRHPAPMFSAAPAAIAPAAQPQVAAAASQPLPSPASETGTNAPASAPVPTIASNSSAHSENRQGDAIGDIIRTGSTTPVSVPTQRAAPQPPQRRDAIADLIRNNGVPMPPRPTDRNSAGLGSAQVTAPADDAQKRMIMTGQQALNRLGYGPLTTDGIMGSGTQAAIKRFEFDRRLPVTGTFNIQTVSELSTTSHLAIR